MLCGLPRIVPPTDTRTPGLNTSAVAGTAGMSGVVIATALVGVLTVIYVVACTDPAVPVTVTTYTCALVRKFAVIVRVLDPVVGFVPKDALTPFGRVEVTAKETLPENPPR